MNTWKLIQKYEAEITKLHADIKNTMVENMSEDEKRESMKMYNLEVQVLRSVIGDLKEA